MATHPTLYLQKRYCYQRCIRGMLAWPSAWAGRIFLEWFIFVHILHLFWFFSGSVNIQSTRYLNPHRKVYAPLQINLFSRTLQAQFSQCIRTLQNYAKELWRSLGEWAPLTSGDSVTHWNRFSNERVLPFSLALSGGVTSVFPASKSQGGLLIFIWD